MQAKDRVYQALQQYADYNNKVTAAWLAEKLDLSRQVVSHYLTRLLEDGLAAKTSTRPVEWYPVSQDELLFFADTEEQMPRVEEVSAEMNKTTAFSELVGYRGSQKQVVEMCMAAVNYPDGGLPMLLTGESGVGKSFLARLIHRYALEQKVIQANAPFVVLNCADYANNPELLSAALLGYKKGSFTGADKDKAGLLQEADGGYLFLDEVHRLSFENQEKLFLFMDTGQYRPLGEQGWKSSKVRFIFATTEQPDEVLLETFRRRITLQVPIPNMIERPLKERIQMLHLFYLKEAKKIRCSVQVDSDAASFLCFSQLKGNIGKLENLIQISCANAYYKQKEEKQLLITMKELPVEGNIREVPYTLPGWTITPQGADSALCWEQELPEEKEIGQLWEMIAKESYDRMDMIVDSIYLDFKRLLRSMQKENNVQKKGLSLALLYAACESILQQYGVQEPGLLLTELNFISEVCSERNIEYDVWQKLSGFFEETMPKAFYVAGRLCARLTEMNHQVGNELVFLFALSLHEYMVETMEFHGLIVAHGDSTASSLQKVANTACQTFVFEAIDMPMDTSVEATIRKVQQYLERINTRKGVVLLVDTGSLNQMYSSIKHNLNGDLLIINNVSTSIALDIGIKLLGMCSFIEIAKSARENYVFEIQYFEGVSRGRNIIVSCMSGVGIAEKLQEAMCKVIDEDVIDVVTMEYQELKRLLKENQKEYFKQTQLILTTSSLPEEVEVPWLNIYDILDGKGESYLWNTLKELITRDNFEELKREYIRFFSIEGIVSRLKFLNPTVVINEVELVLLRYEQHYKLEMAGHIRLNLYMHIAFMIERLMTTEPREEEQSSSLSEKEIRFYKTSREIFADMETKYRIYMNAYELSLLYELFKRIIIEEH